MNFALPFLIGIFILIGLYFIISEGDPKRTKRLLHLKKEDIMYKHDTISAIYGAYIIGYAGMAFILHLLFPLGIIGIIIWIALYALYFFSASFCFKKYVIDNKRLKYS